MEWTQTAPQPTPVIEIQDGGFSYYATNTGSATLTQAIIDYAGQSTNESPRTVQVRDLTLGAAGTTEACSVPIPEEPEWNQGWPGTELIAKFHVVDNGNNFNAMNPTAMSLEDGAAHYAAALWPDSEIFVCENREPHEITIREVSSGAGNGEWSAFTVPEAEE